ncbi:hypothetical protein B0H14DRAFT_3429895 [Mycena olivaceomarginata]|nr:hypothetical protein B0H14DRAFT_3429895 [Mycena olivaceomarginata]
MVDYYRLDLGSGSADSLCCSPALAPSTQKEPERDFGIWCVRHAFSSLSPCFRLTHLIISVVAPRSRLGRPQPRPPRARTPGPEASRAVLALAYAIALVMLEPDRVRVAVRSLLIHARRALAPSAGPIRGGRSDRLLTFRARVRALQTRRHMLTRSAASWAYARRIDRSPPSLTPIPLYSSVTIARKTSSHISQLRTGPCHLNARTDSNPGLSPPRPVKRAEHRTRRGCTSVKDPG